MKALRSFRRFLDRSPWYVKASYFALAFGGINSVRGYSLQWAIISGVAFSALMTPFYVFWLRRQKAKAGEDGRAPS